MSQICESCNYETYDLSNFDRHKKSKNILNKTYHKGITKRNINS